MNLELPEYIQLLRRHARAILLLCLSATILAFSLSYLISDTYEATALIVVRPNENIHISSNKDDKELLSFPVSGGGKIEVASNTYIEAIKSRAVAEKVVRKLHLDSEDDTVATTYYEKVRGFLKDTLRDYLSAAVQLLKYGKFIGKLPRFEKAVDAVQRAISVTAIKDTYLFEIKYAADHPKTAAAVANAAADLFLGYMAEINALATKATLIFLEERAGASQRELVEARRALRDFKERNKTISFKEETTEEIKIISELEASLEKAEVKLASYLQQFTAQNPKVLALEAEKTRLLAALRQRRSQINQLPDKERELATLTLNLQVAEEIYQLINKESEEARIRAGKQVSEIKVVSAAVAPFYPAKPKRAYYGAAAFSISLLIGIGFILLLEYLNTTIRRVQDVERALELPVLATLPEMAFTSKPK